ncbi:hypothetical protein ACIOHE_26395 [Streptomyces sp. NPDC087851]|uniref:hypothetical protein n=1 Tax=Streptomyces sp. NPDC087851 TaxID=3365810 RepID=UPI003800AFAA
MAITAPKPGGNDDMLKALEALAAGGIKAGGAADVYMGTMPGRATAQNEKYGTSPRRKDRWLSEEQAVTDFYGWNTKRQSDFLAQGVIGGLLRLGDGPMEAGKLWTKLVKEAGQYGKAGQKVSPFDLLASYVKASGGTQKESWASLGAFKVNTVTGEKRYVGPGTYLGNGRAQQVDTRTDMTDPDTAKAIATKLFQDLMGRDPGAGELGAFASALHSAEANAPVTQTTETQYDMETGQPIASDTTSTGGMTAEGRAYLGEQQIKRKTEYGALQAATTYQNAFDSLIFGSPE